LISAIDAEATGGPRLASADVLQLTRGTWLDILAEAWRVYPLEACGLLIGRPGDRRVERFVAVTNADQSSRVYTLESREYLRAARTADDEGLDIVGVVHSHTHTAAYPSPTDVEKAQVPDWHWAIVSLAWGLPELRSFRIEDGGIREEHVSLLAS
jgi:[CysO sulfur-carrier protein]-S-L-cysteine hydrolase